MTISISAYTGFYIKAPRPDCSGTVLVSVCPKHGDVDVAFCPTCGEKVIKQAKFIESKNSIAEILYDPEGEFASTLKPEDVEFIRQNVTHIEAENVNDDGDVDYFIIGDDYVYIDADNGGVMGVDIEEVFHKPDQSDVDRIVKAIGYQTYQMQFGTLISVSY